MSKHRQEIWENELAKCIKCGTCRSVCQVFQSVDDESYVARGKMRLVDAYLNNKINLTDGLAQRMSMCLMCKACTASCPSGVKTDRVFLEMRNYLAEEKGLSKVKRMAFTWLKYRNIFDFSLRFGAFFQGLVFKELPDRNGRIPRFPIPVAGFNQRRIIPTLAKRPLRSMLPEVVKIDKPKMRVAFFTGCMMNYVYPESGLALVDVLRANDIEVVTPKKQQCCGTPIFTSGDFKTGRLLVKQNLTAFCDLDVDAIVAGCASGGVAWKHEFQTILEEDDEMLPVAKKLAEKSYDISEFLSKIELNNNFGRVEKTVTYHDPCHLNRGQGISKEPRDLIKAIPGIKFIEMSHADNCCGSGGSFNLSYYEVSRDINNKKVKSIGEVKPDIVLTGCSACRMHIEDGLFQSGLNIPVRHTIELLAESYRKQGVI
ncbi:MAG: (Fe-S)-binding protein [Desulfitobacteriaceae bacterium]|nr:(Fe-S)-binding protein [Desulfitobacteriaceae bacterium]